MSGGGKQAGCRCCHGQQGTACEAGLHAQAEIPEEGSLHMADLSLKLHSHPAWLPGTDHLGTAQEDLMQTTKPAQTFRQSPRIALGVYVVSVAAQTATKQGHLFQMLSNSMPHRRTLKQGHACSCTLCHMSRDLTHSMLQPILVTRTA